MAKKPGLTKVLLWNVIVHVVYYDVARHKIHPSRDLKGNNFIGLLDDRSCG